MQAISCICGANGSKILVVKRTFTYLEKYLFLPLYKTLIRPHLEYATYICGTWFVKDIETVKLLRYSYYPGLLYHTALLTD